MQLDPDRMAPADRALWDAMGEATPRYSPMPTPGAWSELPAVSVVARHMGRPLIPWQAWAVRIITERTPDRRRYRHSVADVTAERQTGKTTVVGAILSTRSILYRRRRALHTAQTGRDAVERWGDIRERIADSTMAGGWTASLRAGGQRLKYSSTGSWIGPFSPTPDSVHGYTPHDVWIDEAYAFDPMEGSDLMAAIQPAQQTIPDRQLICTSTRGDARSVWHEDRVARGREDPDGQGYLEWSIPDGADPHDPDAWAFHPGLGHLIDLDGLQRIHDESTEPLWLRAYCNRPVSAAEPILDMEAWASTAVADLPDPAREEVYLGYAYEGSSYPASIVGAWRLPDGRVGMQTILRADMTPDALAEAVHGMSGSIITAIATDGAGESVLVADMVESRAVGTDRHHVLGVAEWVLASLGLERAIESRTIVHAAGDEVLTDALARAVSRTSREAWYMSHSSPPLAIAAAAALRALEAKQPVVPSYEIRWSED